MDYNYINLESINKIRDNLINFSNITEENIRDIWYKQGEEYLTDFKNLKYDYNIPLYQKMIFRFRNNKKIATGLYQGCDPVNKKKLLSFFKIYGQDNINLIEFFAWIYNYLTHQETTELIGNEDYIDIRIKNNIIFFFILTSEKQNFLINRYNEECITVYKNLK